MGVCVLDSGILIEPTTTFIFFVHTCKNSGKILFSRHFFDSTSSPRTAGRAAAFPISTPSADAPRCQRTAGFTPFPTTMTTSSIPLTPVDSNEDADLPESKPPGV